MNFKYILSLGILLIFYVLMRFFLAEYSWLATLNLILDGSLFLILIDSKYTWIWAIGGGILLDIGSVLPFGTHLIIILLITWLLKILLREIFSQLSWGASLALSFGGIGLYYIFLAGFWTAAGALGILNYNLDWSWVMIGQMLLGWGLNFLLVGIPITVYRLRLKQYMVYDQGYFWHS